MNLLRMCKSEGELLKFRVGIRWNKSPSWSRMQSHVQCNIMFLKVRVQVNLYEDLVHVLRRSSYYEDQDH